MTNRTVTVHYYAGLDGGWNAKLRRDGVHVTIGGSIPSGEDASRLAHFLALVATGADRELLRHALDSWGKIPAAAVVSGMPDIALPAPSNARHGLRLVEGGR